MCSMMGCAEGIVKLFMFAGNILFAIGGIALIAVGVLYKLNFSHYTDAIPDDYQAVSYAPIFTIVIGSIIFVIAFMGCCGAIRESTCLLTTYAVILLVIFLLQIAVGVFAFLEIKDETALREKIDSSFSTLFRSYSTHTELVDVIQSELHCCGTTDYQITPIPASCYEGKDSTGPKYGDSCNTSFYDFLSRAMEIIGITVLALSALEVIGCVFSLCLSSSIKNRERRFRY